MTSSAALTQFATSHGLAVQAHPADNAASGASTGTNTISSNDFLTLLVTEMKNQDPTNAADPSQYVNQLVSVNSLEQLIEINQTLSGVLTAPSSGPAAPPSSPTSQVAAPISHSAGVPLVTPGNLGLPPANPAAQQVARALAPHPRA